MSPMPRFAARTTALLLFAGAAFAADSRRYVLEDDQVYVGVQAQVGSRQVVTVSRSLDGVVSLGSEGGKVRLSLPVASFESGNPVVDAALRAALEADRFPTIDLDASAPGASRDATVIFTGALRLHGVEQKVVVPVRVVREGTLAFANLTFSLDLTRYGVALPTLGGVRVGDRVEVQVAARLHQASAVAAN